MNEILYTSEFIRYTGEANSILLLEMFKRLNQNGKNYFTNLMLSSVELKSPMLAFVLNIFLGTLGVARFYIGDFKRGAIYLICLIIGQFIFGIFALVPLIGWIIDIFMIIKTTREQNFAIINNYLNKASRIKE